MDKKEIFSRIEYIVTCVGAFAQRYDISNMQAYAYLRRFTGIDFLLDCYAGKRVKMTYRGREAARRRIPDKLF